MSKSNKLGRYLHNIDGSVAVEFSIVLPVFIFLLFSLLNIGWSFVQVVMLDRAVLSLSREILTGEKGNIGGLEVVQKACNYAIILGDCADHLRVEFVEVEDASSIPTDSLACPDVPGAVAPLMNYTVSSARLVMVRACYSIRSLVPGIETLIGAPSPDNGYYNLVSRTLFVSEPIY